MKHEAYAESKVSDLNTPSDQGIDHVDFQKDDVVKFEVTAGIQVEPTREFINDVKLKYFGSIQVKSVLLISLT